MTSQMKINFKQPKYILPAILYFPLLGLGYLIIDIFHTEIPDEVQSDLQTTEYLNAELPTANVKEGLGGKRENVEKTFGNIMQEEADRIYITTFGYFDYLDGRGGQWQGDGGSNWDDENR